MKTRAAVAWKAGEPLEIETIEIEGPKAGEAYKTVRDELEAYGHGLSEKPEIVALSKADALTAKQIKEQTARLKRASKKTPLVLSALSGAGVQQVLRALLEVINETRLASGERAPSEMPAWQP